VEDNIEEGTVDVHPAVVLNEAEFAELIHKETPRERVVPIISASSS
jgi:hypothetical protein